MSKRDVRSEVILAVYGVCAEHGLENLTTKKLSEESHCSEAMIYYHFRSKKEILEAAFLNIHSEIDAIFRNHFIEKGLVLERDTFNVCLETWMLYYAYWRDRPARRAFYDAFIHSNFVTKELWMRDNASYVFFSSMFGRLMGDIAQASGESAFALIWPIIIESAIQMARRANETGEGIDENAKALIGKVLQAILSFASEGRQPPSV